MHFRFIARVAHEVNRAYCQFIGDDSQAPWNEAPQWVRDSALDGVAAIEMNPDLTPEESHENWLRHKEETGWRYGPVKSESDRTHPCMVPYLSLPPEQRLKDLLFTTVVKELLKS